MLHFLKTLRPIGTMSTKNVSFFINASSNWEGLPRHVFQHLYKNAFTSASYTSENISNKNKKAMDVTFVFKPGVKHSRGPTITIYHPEIPERVEKRLRNRNPGNENETSQILTELLQNVCLVRGNDVDYIEAKAINALTQLLTPNE